MTFNTTHHTFKKNKDEMKINQIFVFFWIKDETGEFVFLHQTVLWRFNDTPVACTCLNMRESENMQQRVSPREREK